MKQIPSFQIIFTMILLLSPIKSQLPVDTILFPTSCAGNSNNCPTYRFSRCHSNNQCRDCDSGSDCSHLTGGSGGDCRSMGSGNTFCYVSCTLASNPCLSMRAFCDTSSSNSFCNQCNTNSDCTSQGYPGTVTCDKTTQSGFGVCSSCSATGTCSVGTCVNYKCVQCTLSTQCSAPTPHCVKKFEGNFCKQCLANGDCASNSALSKCDSNTNTCVKCTASPDCSLIVGKNHCSSTLGCVQCTSDSHCSGGTPFCSNAGTCVQCDNSGDCPRALPLCSSGGTCGSCTGNALSCLRFITTFPYCANSGINNGACVKCTQNSHCGGGTPICTTSNTCVQCTQNSQCSRTSPICSGSNTCTSCTDSTVCSTLYSPSYPYCATSGTNTGDCVRCTSSTHCSSPTPYCSSGNTCVQCTANSHCSATAPLCSSGVCSACTDSTVCGANYASTLPYCATSGINSGDCVRCTQDSHCPGPGFPYCTTSNTCVQCLTYANCAVATPECSTSFTCTSCTSSTVCNARFPGTQPYCATSGSNSGTCVRCTQASHCSAPTPYCSTSNTCVACLTDANCPLASAPVCSAGSCVACSNPTASVCSTRFSATLPYCSTSGTNSGACVRCTSDSHCSGGTPYCSSINTCVACTANSHCSAGTPFCSTGGVCTACTDSSVCAAQYSSTLPYCATSGTNSGACVRCLSSGNCAAGTPYCSPANTCVQCLSDNNCPSTAPDCSSSYNCVSCTTNTICNTRFSGTQPYCATTGSNAGGCVRCTLNTHCSGGTPYCSSGSNTCVACLTDSNCPLPSAPICSGGTCQSCTSSSICLSRFSGTPVCFGGTCVECGTASDCPSNKPICLSNNCVECSSSAQCSTATKPYCSTSTNSCDNCPSSSFCNTKSGGSLPFCYTTTGACVQCLANSDCSGGTPFCSPSTKTCVQCLDDTNCVTTSAPKCSASNTCQPCTGYSGICASKFTNQPVCSSGNCVGCGSSSDCSNPLKPICSTMVGACVQCTVSSECPSVNAPYCDTGTGTCQPCTSSPTAICPGRFPSTPVCYNDQCVECATDSDCSADPSKPNCMNMICKATVYSAECLPQYNIQAYQTTDLNVFSLNFPSDLVAKTPNLQSVLTLTLVNIPSADYTYVLTKLSDNNYQATFTFQATIPATELRITLPCPAQHGYSFGDIKITIPTLKVAFTTPEIQKTIETIQSVATTATTVMAGASGSMMLAGANPAIMWALIGLLQTFYYMIFINVQYPANVQAFFGLFTMGNLSFIPNPMGWFFPNIDNESLDAPSKFLENEVDGLFLQGGGNELLMWFVVIMGYILSKLFLSYTRNMPRVLSGSAAKTVSMFEWSGVLRTLITSYTQLAMAAFLQIRVLNFNGTLFSLSSITGILFTIFSFAFPFAVYWLISKYRKSAQKMKIKYSTLIEEYKFEPNEVIPQYYSVFFLVRRLVLVLTLVYSHNSPYLEIFILILNCLIWLVLLIKYRPYDTKINNFVNIISEACFIGVHVLIMLLIHGDYTNWLSEQKRLDIGWGIIGACGFILVMTLVASFVQQYYTMKKMIQLLIQVIKKSKNDRAKKTRVKRIKSPTIYPMTVEPMPVPMSSPTIYPMDSMSRSSSLALNTIAGGAGGTTIDQGYTGRELLESSSSFRGPVAEYDEIAIRPENESVTRIGTGTESLNGTRNGMSNYKIAKRVNMGENPYKLGRFKR